MVDESAPYPLSQERLSPEETGYKSGIPTRQVRHSPEPSREQKSTMTPMVLILLVVVEKLLINAVNKVARQTIAAV